MSQTSTKSERSPKMPAGTFSLTSSAGKVCDLTPLILDGAKLTVLFSQLCYDWGISYNLHRAEYHQLRRQCKTWQSAGLVTYETKTYDSCFVGIDQRSGVFVRATSRTPPETPNLIRSLQNSKSFAEPQKRLRLEKDEPLNLSSCQDERDIWKQMYAPQPETHRDYLLPGGRMSWFRLQAIRKCMGISDPNLFIRKTRADGKTYLNPELVGKLNNMQNLFEAWKEDVEKKNIILYCQSKRYDENGNLMDPYAEIPYRTRFTDVSRQIKNETTYENAIERSLELFETGIFITLTTDPQIQMRPKGEEFLRHVKEEKQTHIFEATGKGGNLWSANRSESKAWRKWYEAECHRRGYRIPYIRVVEFQKNGLIHTHILMFGCKWDISWHEFAEAWGTRYGQGFANKVYDIVKSTNESGEAKWVWADKSMKPKDTKGREPADYLKKYLRKAQGTPYIEKDSEGAIIKQARDGRFMYWVCGKRFFTISQCLRVYDFDELIEKEDRQSELWEFVGAPYAKDTLDVIRAHMYAPNKPPQCGPPDKEIPQKTYEREEDPDINDDAISEIILESVSEEIDPARIAYEQQLAQEDRWRLEHRERLRKNKEKEK